MSIWKRQASNGGGSSELPPEGNHLASCVALVDLGTHVDSFNGKDVSNRKLLICWELASEFDSAGSPFVVGFDFNVPESLSSKSKLRGLMEKWRGKPLGDGEEVDIAKVLGKPCLLNLGHALSSKDKPYCKLFGISPPLKGMSIPAPAHRPYIWGFDDGEPLRLPEWLPWLYGRSIQDWIDEARESKPQMNPRSSVGLAARTEGTVDVNEEIPF